MSGDHSFPVKLHYVLNDIEKDGFAEVVSWQPHGMAFVVHKQNIFVEQFLPLYFKQTKIASFQRQLNLYGFKRLTIGPDKGGYYHPFFVRKKPELARKIERATVKGTKVRKPASPETEPNFYVTSTALDKASLVSAIMSQSDDQAVKAPLKKRGLEEEGKDFNVSAQRNMISNDESRNDEPQDLLLDIFASMSERQVLSMASTRDGLQFLHHTPTMDVSSQNSSGTRTMSPMIHHPDNSLILSLLQQQQQLRQSLPFPSGRYPTMALLDSATIMESTKPCLDTLAQSYFSHLPFNI